MVVKRRRSSSERRIQPQVALERSGRSIGRQHEKASVASAPGGKRVTYRLPVGRHCPARGWTETARRDAEYAERLTRYSFGMARQREFLIVQSAGAPERRVELSKRPLRIGRGSDNQLVLADEYVSTSHAEVVRQDSRWQVRDLGSTNGTELNGQPLAPGTAVLLDDGDVLRLGSCTLTYRAEPAPNGTTRFARPPAADEPGAEPARPSRAFALLRGLVAALLRLVLLVLVALLVLAGVVWALAPPRLSLLVLGSDARPDELRRGDPGRTDTLMTVVADRPPAGVAIVSLPRDLWVTVPGHGEERINVAHALGGPETARRTVSGVLGVPVDHYLMIGLQGVREVVDAAGGIEIDVPAPIHDAAYPTDDYGTLVVNIPAGRQRMDGETALRYARTRHQDNDFGRVARQQQVLLALRSELLRPTSWWRLPAVLEAVRRTTRTDLGPLELAALGLSLVGSPAGPERLVVAPPLVEPFGGADGAYLLSPTPGLRRSVAAFLTPAAARVEVLNGTATSGAARQAAERLHEGGMATVRYGDAARPRSATTIETRPGAARAGRLAASILNQPAETVHEVADLPDDVDVRVTLGDRGAR